MSTASHVKETYELTGDDARQTLLNTGRVALLKDAVVRLRAADGTTYAGEPMPHALADGPVRGK